MTYLRLSILLSYLILLCLPLANATPTEQMTLAELDEKISKIVEESKIPSVAYALVYNSNNPHINVMGMADIENKQQATPQTLYRIGSVSKMFTSFAILKLVEEERLHLDDEVSSILPNVKFYNPWQQTHPIRVVHLLEHTTGWDNLAFKEFAHHNTPTQSLLDNLSYYPESRTSRWPPGTRSAYTNSGAAVAAKIVEKITGEIFEDFINDTIFTPLKMSNSTYFNTKQVEAYGAKSYRGNKKQPYKHLFYRPAGSVNASIGDMAIFTQLLLQRGGPLLKQTSIDRMERSESTNAGTIKFAHGLDNAAINYGPWVYRGHDGSVDGALAELRYSPKAKVGFVVLMNANKQGAMQKIVTEIVNYQTNQLPLKDIKEVPTLSTSDDKLDGLYYTINPGFDLAHFINRLIAVYRVRQDENKLAINGLIFQQSPKHLIQVNQQSFVSAEHGMIELSVASDPIDGQVLHYKDKVLKPTNAITIYGQLLITIVWLISIFSTLLMFLLNCILRVFGKKSSLASSQIRKWPIAASLSGLFFLISLILGMQNPYVNLGGITGFSVIIMLSTITFAAFTLVAVYTIIKTPISSVNKIAFGYYSGCTLLHLLVLFYFLYFGIIGLQIWT